MRLRGVLLLYAALLAVSLSPLSSGCGSTAVVLPPKPEEPALVLEPITFFPWDSRDTHVVCFQRGLITDGDALTKNDCATLGQLRAMVRGLRRAD